MDLEGIVEVRSFSLFPGLGKEEAVNALLEQGDWVLLSVQVIQRGPESTYSASVVYILGRKTQTEGTDQEQ